MLLFIARVELMPPMLALREWKRAAVHFVVFVVGVGLIALSALKDTHCDAATGHTHAH